MTGIIKPRIASKRKTHQNLPAHDTVSLETSGGTTRAEQKNTGIPDIRHWLDGKLGEETYLNGFQISSLENTNGSDFQITHHLDQCHEESTFHVRLPSAKPRWQPPRMASLSSDAKLKSYAFGWETFPTKAMKNEVCQAFLQRRCRYGSMCLRIHPWRNPLLPGVRVPTKTMLDQECRNGNQVMEGHNVAGPLLQVSPCTEDLLMTQDSPMPIVKLPSKGQKRARPEHPLSRQSIGKSSPIPKTEGSGEVTSKVHIRNRSNERSSFDRSLLDLSSDFTYFPLSLERIGSDVLVSKIPGYSDLHWDPQTNFWGYHINERAWTDSVQTSDSNTSVHSIFSSSTASSSQSSLTEEAPATDRNRPTVKPPPPKHSEFCRNWLLNRCQRGYCCLYVHGDLEYDPPARGRHPPPLYPEVCYKWLRNECTSGYACRFVHGDLEYDSLTIGGTGTEKRVAASRVPAPPLSVTVHDHVKVKLIAGFDIQDLTTGFETHWVFLDNIPVRVSIEDINRLLEPFGRVVDIQWRTRVNSSKKTARVRLSTPTEASQASVALDGAQAFDATISARLPVNDSQKSTVFQDTAVRVQWSAPSKVAYGGYPTMEKANKAIEAARIPFRDHLIKASIHVGLPVVGIVTVRFQGVPHDANQGDMERFARPDDVVWERPNYTSLPRAIHGIQRILEEDTEPLSFDVLPPPYKNGATVCAWAHFATPGNAKAACNRLHARRPMCIGRTMIFARHVRSLSYTLSPAMHAKLDSDIQLLRRVAWFRGRTTISVVIRNPLQPIIVKLSGEDLKELGQLKSEFEKILHGEVVRQNGKVAWDGFFARPAGNLFIMELERANPGVTITRDEPRRMIRLLGSAQNRGKVREKLLMKLHELRSQRIRTIPLNGRLIGLFMGKDLLMLREELGPENVNLDIVNRNLQIRGNDVAYEAAQEAIRRALRRHPAERNSDMVECPVCFSHVVTPITLSCGHSWCRVCLKNYITSSIDNKYFPLTCLGNEAKCTEKISLKLAREILPAPEFDAVVNAAFSFYVQSRPDEFHYCPSPDCPQIYRTAGRDTVLQCPSCLLRLCSNCHVEAHDGFACPESEDSLFQEWMKHHDVKNCPGCKIPIERAEGCNHMTCTQCQTHICWVCLQTFPRGEGIYDHMRSVHGDIGLGPVF